MQDYERKSISDVIENINNKYFLPDIQRNFVWKPEQVYNLFDSIMRDYPISTFLFWKQDGAFFHDNEIKKLEFISKSTDKNSENQEVIRGREYFLVLDGQQRLSSFFLVLKGNYIMYNNPYDLYFNIFSGGQEQEDGILYEFKFFNSNQGSYFSETINDPIKLWINVKDIYDINNLYKDIDEIAKKIQKDLAIDITLHDGIRDNIASLCQHLKFDKIIYYYPEVAEDYDEVLDIFIRTNSGGTKLSYSDLLFSTIKSKWTDAREKFAELIENINRGSYKFSNDFVLKTVLVLYAQNSDGIRYKAKNFSPNLINKLKVDFKKIQASIHLMVDLLSDRFLLNSDKMISSYNATIPLIYWINKKGIKGIGAEKNCLNDSEIKKMQTWLIKSLISGVFSGQSDTILYKCKESIDKELSISDSFPAKSIEAKINSETKKSMNIDSDKLDKISYNSKDSHLILSICYKGAINFQPRLKGNMPEQDHIFSQNELRKAGVSPDKINSIYNIRYIGGSENKIKSNTPFANWLSSIGQDQSELKKHLIPKGTWNVDNYDDFLAERKKLIVGAFKY